MLKWFTVKKDFSTVIVSETEYVFVPLARLLCSIWKKSLVFDAFFSYYDMTVNDRKTVRPNSLTARRYHYFDELGCRLADRIMVDTEQHAQFFISEFNVPGNKIDVIRVGADESIYFPVEATKSEKHFSVLFTGTYIPLHGVEIIIKAAEILKDEPIDFLLIGDGQTRSDTTSLARSLKLNNIKFMDYLPENELARYVNAADLCLGIFGSSQKSTRVIPCKIYSAIACAKPVLTMDSPAIRECFIDGVNIALCKPSKPESLAEKILELKNDPSLRKTIARNSYKLFNDTFTPAHLVKPLVERLNSGVNK